MEKSINFAILFLCTFGGGLMKGIPDYVKICKRDQSTINDCIRDSIEALRPKLLEGIPELEVLGIDPLYIPQEINVKIEAFPLSASIQDLKVTGAGSFVIKSLSVDVESFTVRTRVLVPKLNYEGRYKVDGLLLTLPIKGQGNFVGDAVKCSAEVTMHTERVERDGMEYLNVTEFDTNIKIKDYSLKLDGLFDGDKVLGDLVNNIISQNRGDFLHAAKPHIQRVATKLLLQFSNKLVGDLPLDMLLPLP